MNDSDLIQKACRLGDVQLLMKILTSSPDLLNESDDKLGWPPLYRTVICGHVDATNFLLKSGADSNIKSKVGDTPLHQAASNDQIKIAQILLKYKADPNAQQDDGDTPLHYAASKGHIGMVRLLLKHQANPNIFNFTDGKTALHCGSESGVLQVVQAMLSYNASISISDFNGKLAFDYTDSEDIKKLLRSSISSPEPNENPSPVDENQESEEEAEISFYVPEVRNSDELYEDTQVQLIGFPKETPVFEDDISRPESVLEPECERSSTISGVNVNNSVRTFSFGKDMEKNSLYK